MVSGAAGWHCTARGTRDDPRGGAGGTDRMPGLPVRDDTVRHVMSVFYDLRGSMADPHGNR